MHYNKNTICPQSSWGRRARAGSEFRVHGSGFSVGPTPDVFKQFKPFDTVLSDLLPSIRALRYSGPTDFQLRSVRTVCRRNAFQRMQPFDAVFWIDHHRAGCRNVLSEIHFRW
jgi:hypothetical protein